MSQRVTPQNWVIKNLTIQNLVNLGQVIIINSNHLLKIMDLKKLGCLQAKKLNILC